MNNEIDEQWLYLPQERRDRRNIVAISNTGKYRKEDGTIGILKLRQLVKYNGKRVYCYRVIADNFLITVKRPDQRQIDHITHHPTEYYVNDMRNLRYCTLAENLRFEEARENNFNWKGDNVGPSGAYKRAKKLYKAGQITEEEFQPYRDRCVEYQRRRKKHKKEHSSK